MKIDQVADRSIRKNRFKMWNNIFSKDAFRIKKESEFP